MLRSCQRLRPPSKAYSTSSKASSASDKPTSFARKPARQKKQRPAPLQSAIKSLPHVPVLSAPPSVIKWDSFFAGDKPLLEIEVDPRRRVDTQYAALDESGLDPKEVLQSRLVGQVDLSLPEEVLRMIAEKKPFQAPSSAPTKQRASSPTALQTLKSALIPPQDSLRSPQNHYLPYELSILAQSFLQDAAARNKQRDKDSIEPLSSSTNNDGPTKEEEKVILAVTKAFTKAIAGLTGGKDISIQVISIDRGTPDQINSALAQSKAKMVLSLKGSETLKEPEQILETVTDLLKKTSLNPLEEGQEEEEQVMTVFKHAAPNRRISLGPRSIARRGGRSVPRIQLARLIIKLDSVKRKRRTKMSKHKYKKRRKVNRAQRKKLGK